MSAGLIAGNYHVRTSMTGREIAGKTLGIIGFGRIGRLVGEIGHRGFGMKVLYHDIVPAPPEVEARSNARRTSLEEVLELSEYVTLHVPLDSSTRRMINRETLALMRPDAILINTCRGPGGRRRGRGGSARRPPALGLRRRCLHRRAAAAGPPADRPRRRDRHAPQRRPDRRRAAHDGGDDCHGRRRHPARRAADEPGE